MTRRSVPLVFVLSFFTCGVYALYWYIVTKREMNTRGAAIPTCWLIVIPIVDLWWLWRFCCGLELVTACNPRNVRLPAVIAFLLHFVFPIFSIGVFQHALNIAANRLPPVGELPVARVV